jgi:ssRNA-specific RNase YbeY (16S rRNA maturation enzyme)
MNAELALYIAHGFDHLSGADDDTPARRAAMRRTEMRWLAGLQPEIKNLILS